MNYKDFVTANVSCGMWDKLVRTGKYAIIPEPLTMEDLKKENIEFSNCIKDNKLVVVLRSNGLNIPDATQAKFINIGSKDIDSAKGDPDKMPQKINERITVVTPLYANYTNHGEQKNPEDACGFSFVRYSFEKWK